MPRVSTFNVEFGHNPDMAWAKMILRRFEVLEIDVQALNEVQDYFGELKALAEAEGHVLLGHGPDSRNALLLRKGRSHGEVGTIPGQVQHWYNPAGHEMTMAEPVVVRSGRATYVVIHAPVEAWVPHSGPGRVLEGPERRVAAYVDFTENLVEWGKQQEVPFLVLGDWNCTPETTGMHSPNWVRRMVGGSYFRPHQNTGHGEIDFGIEKGAAAMHEVHVIPPPRFGVPGEEGGAYSDHLQVVGDVGWPRH